jgi:HSP20 family molecular chaperone IbpA
MAEREQETRKDVMSQGDLPEFSPAVDVFDRGEEIVLIADMPGVSRDSVDIHLDRGVLSIRGRVPPPAVSGVPVLEEFQIGDFVRTFTLSEEIDASAIAADLHNGVLTLRLPKSEERKPRKITVKVE